MQVPSKASQESPSRTPIRSAQDWKGPLHSTPIEQPKITEIEVLVVDSYMESLNRAQEAIGAERSYLVHAPLMYKPRSGIELGIQEVITEIRSRTVDFNIAFLTSVHGPVANEIRKSGLPYVVLSTNAPTTTDARIYQGRDLKDVLRIPHALRSKEMWNAVYERAASYGRSRSNVHPITSAPSTVPRPTEYAFMQCGD